MMTTTINGFRDSDAVPDVEYVLELPADRASTLRGELMRMGVPGDRINVIEPGRVLPQIPPTTTTAVVGSSRGQQTGPEKKKPNGNDGCGDGRRRRQRAARFLPGSIKLGTYSGGRYDVSIRRRAAPDGREFVWISMAARKATDKTAATDRTAAADRTAATAAERNDGTVRFAAAAARDDDRDANGLAVVMRRCRCAGAACDDYRDALRKHLEFGGGGGGGGECVYRRLADALPEANVDDGQGADDERVKQPPVVTSVGQTTEGDDDDDADHAGRLTGGGSVDDGPASEPEVGLGPEPEVSDGPSGREPVDGRAIADDTTSRQQACRRSDGARFFDGDANGDRSSTDRSGDRRSTTAAAAAAAVVAGPSRAGERGTAEQRSRPDDEAGAKRPKKSLLDRLPWRATNRTERPGGRRRDADDRP